MHSYTYLLHITLDTSILFNADRLGSCFFRSTTIQVSWWGPLQL